MKRGHSSTDIVVLSLVALIALGGILFLFVDATVSPHSISDAYGPNPGISEVTKLPPYNPFGPKPEFPAGPTTTIGTRTPILIFFKGEYGNIYEMSKCWNDLSWKMAAPQEAFSCFAVPTSAPAYEVTGFFWPHSAALPRPLYDIGGDIYCYERTPYDRDELFNRFKKILLEKGWIIEQVNGLDVLVCQKGKEFLFPQGLRPGYV